MGLLSSLRKEASPAPSKPKSFQTPMPPELSDRINALRRELGCDNQAQVLFEAINLLTEAKKKEGLTRLRPLPQRVITDFRPYGTNPAP